MPCLYHNHYLYQRNYLLIIFDSFSGECPYLKIYGLFTMLNSVFLSCISIKCVFIIDMFYSAYREKRSMKLWQIITFLFAIMFCLQEFPVVHNLGYVIGRQTLQLAEDHEKPHRYSDFHTYEFFIGRCPLARS